MPKGRSRWCLAFVCAVASLFSSLVRAEPPLSRSLLPGPAHAADEREFTAATVRAYQRGMALGVEEFTAGRWAEARALFLRGHALMPNARSSRALGMTAFNLKHYTDALRELSDALDDPRRPLDQALRKQTEELRERAQTFVASYHLRVEPTGAELRVDGVVTKLASRGGLLLGVGEHVLELEAPGYARLTRPVLVEGRGDQHLSLHLERLAQPTALLQLKRDPEPPAGPRAASLAQKPYAEQRASHAVRERVFADYRFTWGFGAGTLALAAAATGLHLSAQAEARAVRAHCQVYQCDPWEGVTEQRDKLSGFRGGLLISTLVFSAVTVAVVLVESQRVLARAATGRKYVSAKSAP